MKWVEPVMIAALLSSGCAGLEPLGGGEQAASTPVPAPVQDAQAALPGSFEAFTSEPRWHLRVDAANAAVLEGEGIRRELRIEMSEAVFDGRYVLARDAIGTVEVRVTQRLCQDASGAMLAYTVRVTIEGTAPLLGCGRPGD